MRISDWSSDVCSSDLPPTEALTLSCAKMARTCHQSLLIPTAGGTMKITMIGSGYVGLVSGACFADFGHDVVCVDKDEGKIAALLEGRMPIYEPGLEHQIGRAHV